MLTRAEALKCDLCGKLVAINCEETPLRVATVAEEDLKKVWMPNNKTHVCITCKRKYIKGGGVAKDWRKGEQV